MIEARHEIVHLCCRDRLRRGRRRRQDAEAVERLQRRQHCGRIRAHLLRWRCPPDVPPSATPDPSAEIRRSISTNRSRQRQVRPVRVGSDVEEDDLALAELALGDERRAVLQPRPHVHVGAEHGRVGQHLTADGYFRRHRRAGKEARCPRSAPASAASTTTARRRACGRRRAAARAAIRRRRSRGADRRSARARRPCSPIPRRAWRLRPTACRCRPA